MALFKQILSTPRLGMQEAAIDINDSGGNRPYHYDWSGPGDFASPSLRIYPVPAEGMLHIRGIEDMRGKIEIFTILGQMVRQMDLQGTMNLESLEKGVSYLRIRDPQRKELDTHRIAKK